MLDDVMTRIRDWFYPDTTLTCRSKNIKLKAICQEKSCKRYNT